MAVGLRDAVRARSRGRERHRGRAAAAERSPPTCASRCRRSKPCTGACESTNRGSSPRHARRSHLGRRFVDGSGSAPPFFHAHGSIGTRIDRKEFLPQWLRARAQGLDTSFEEFSLTAAAARRGRMLLPDAATEGFGFTDYGYHLPAIPYARLAAAAGAAPRRENAGDAHARSPRRRARHRRACCSKTGAPSPATSFSTSPDPKRCSHTALGVEHRKLARWLRGRPRAQRLRRTARTAAHPLRDPRGRHGLGRAGGEPAVHARSARLLQRAGARGHGAGKRRGHGAAAGRGSRTSSRAPRCAPGKRTAWPSARPPACSTRCTSSTCTACR